MELRIYRSGDLLSITRLFYDTVHTVNAADYTPRQLDAWADGHPDLEAWDRSFRAHHTLVAVEGGILVGFGDMAPDGYLDRLYVHHTFQRRGIASQLCRALEAAVGAPVLTVHASITARPFFERQGYRTLAEQQVECHGVPLTNYRMEKCRLRPNDRPETPFV